MTRPAPSDVPNSATNWDASAIDSLLEDMDGAICELAAPLEKNVEVWTHGPAGKWTAGQQVDHVVRVMALTADPLEAAAAKLRAGTLGKRPWRDPLQAWFVRLVTSDPFPRRGKALGATKAGPAPDRGLTLQSLAEVGARHRNVALGLTPEERRALWIWSPFIPLPWHYTLSEILRVHATHGRHHARLVRDAVRCGRSSAA